jgi:probable HAF family extracellular repeat protein
LPKTIEITFADPGGSGLNHASITDSAAEFTMSGPGVGTASISSSAPALVDPGATYRYSFNGNFVPGDVTLSFPAGVFRDNAGNQNLAFTQSFTVEDINNLSPTVTSFTGSPDPVAVNGTITLTAIASDSDGSVSSISFYLENNGSPGLQIGGDRFISTDSNSPYNASVDTAVFNQTAGNTYTYYAVATDNLSTLSPPRSTTNTIQSSGNLPPVITEFTDSPDPAFVNTSVTLRATASDPDGTIANVVFYFENNGIEGLQTGPGGDHAFVAEEAEPYELNLGTQFFEQTVGNTYTYYAVATDNQGATSEIRIATNTIRGPNFQSSVRTLEVSPDPVAANAKATLIATATDPDGFIVSISFYQETNGETGLQTSDRSLSTDTTSEYSHEIIQSIPGTYTYYAVALDNEGRSSMPREVISTVYPAPPIAPADVTASDGNSMFDIHIAWTDSGAHRYVIFRSPTNDSTVAAELGITANNFWDDSDAIPGVDYYYWVKARDILGQLSEFSNGDTGFVLAVPRIIVDPRGTGSVTTEYGRSLGFDIRLGTVPTAPVTVQIRSSDLSEGVPSLSDFVFDATNWRTRQQFAVAGVDDAVFDGLVQYYLVVSPAVSADPNYNGRDAAPIELFNEDNDGFFYRLTYRGEPHSYSFANAVSDDGSVIVGSSIDNGSSSYAARWRNPTIPVEQIPANNPSGATDTSANGSVVVGTGNGDQPEAFHYSPDTGLQNLGTNTRGNAVSADGLVAVGGHSSISCTMEAFLWTHLGGMKSLGNCRSEAKGVSADGSVIVGYMTIDNREDAFRWTLATGMQSLGDMGRNSEATDVSADGSVIVGRAGTFVDRGGVEAFRWVNNVAVSLGDLPGGDNYSFAQGVSADGSVVVGGSSTGSGDQAFIWDAVHRMRNLRQVLTEDYAMNMSGWNLWRAQDVSADGRTIVGGGDFQGQTQGWVVHLPEQTNAERHGTRSTDNFVLRLDESGTRVQLFENGSASGTPAFSMLKTVLQNLLVTMGDGDDTLTIDCSNGNPIPLSGLTFDGGIGNETINTNCASFNGVQLADDPSSLILNINGVAFALSSDLSEERPNVVVNVNGSASVTLETTLHLAALHLNDQSRAVFASGGGRSLNIEALTIASGATLDLRDSQLIMQATGDNAQDINSLSNLLQSGRNSGATPWTGPGIISSSIAADSSRSLGIAIGDDTVAVRIALVGDLNMDNSVSISDFIDLASNFGKTNATWLDGDVNHDGAVTISDFIDLAAHFNQTMIASVAATSAQAPAAMENVIITSSQNAELLEEAHRRGKKRESETAAPTRRQPRHRQRHHRAPIRTAPPSSNGRWLAKVITRSVGS